MKTLERESSFFAIRIPRLNKLVQAFVINIIHTSKLLCQSSHVCFLILAELLQARVEIPQLSVYVAQKNHRILRQFIHLPTSVFICCAYHTSDHAPAKAFRRTMAVNSTIISHALPEVQSKIPVTFQPILSFSGSNSPADMLC